METLLPLANGIGFSDHAETMKILALSDLHNEFAVFEPPRVEVDVVVLAGDIDRGDEGIRWARQQWRGSEIVYVAGNHEYYGGDFFETLALLRRTAAAHGVRLLENGEAFIGSVRFLGATLWTDFEFFGAAKSEAAMEEGRRRMNDFALIRDGELGAFTPARSVELHRESLGWLKSKLDERFAGPTVVVTHHLPSLRSVAPRFVGTPLSACFVSNLDYLFGRMDCWIHGHTHESFDYVADGTRVVCNPRGYVTSRGAENEHFDPSKILVI